MYVFCYYRLGLCRIFHKNFGNSKQAEELELFQNIHNYYLKIMLIIAKLIMHIQDYQKITANSFCVYDGRVGRQYIVPTVQKY